MALVRPIVLYGNKFWTVNKEDEEKLMTIERKILRKFWDVSENRIWRIRCNLEFQSKCIEPNIVNVIKASLIRRPGHAFQYSDENLLKKITFQIPEGKREKKETKKQGG
ncbi:hypothetical protein TNCV_4623031 [Trichonephila clavipes]|nr:hypothetical protein TNCV_4623031 [Trichonephila clavipes]